MSKDTRLELPWAHAKRRGFTGEAPGLYFFYFRTRAEAEKSRAAAQRMTRYAGKIEYRPGECYQLGGVL